MPKRPWIICSSNFKGHYSFRDYVLCINEWPLFYFDGDLLLHAYRRARIDLAGFRSFNIFNQFKENVTDLGVVHIPEGYGVMIDVADQELVVCIVPLK